jgi:hypothetical protein
MRGRRLSITIALCHRRRVLATAALQVKGTGSPTWKLGFTAASAVACPTRSDAHTDTDVDRVPAADPGAGVPCRAVVQLIAPGMMQHSLGKRGLLIDLVH